ncbi:hypothetical protein WIS52_23515 [Pseudonocardia nematodicida]|uniref:ABC transporter n=1 Tax=Pseudonocardia nematodicida TaxID=1206997 RepID=A0ABV1KG59_9PSEU
MPTSPVRRVLCPLALVAALASGCAIDPEPPGEGAPHGYVEGAEETAEAQTRLVVADAGSGAVTVLDLLTEEATEVASVPGPRGMAGDGRFGYVAGVDGVTRIVDSGAWTVDHGDHVHYYRTGIGEVGELPGEAPLAVVGDDGASVLSAGSGAISVLDRAALEDGAIAPGAGTAGATGAAVPLAGRVLVATTSPGAAGPARVSVRDREGDEVAALAEPCPAPEGAALTRRGAVFGCADGALLVTEKDGEFSALRIPYPEPVAEGERARSFTGRPGSSTLAARAGDEAAWSLDLGARTWTRIATGSTVAVTTVGEDGPFLALGPDGVLRALDPADGRTEAERPLLDADAVAEAEGLVTIELDTERAYVNDPSGGTIHEIDHGDDLRVARTLQVPGRASFMIETGR